MRNRWASLIVAIVLVGAIRADMGPITYDGYTLISKTNSDIRMKSEEVNIYWGDRIRVVATFEMQNDANNPIGLLVGFPVQLEDAAPRHRDPLTGAPIQKNVMERPVYDFQVTVNEKDKLSEANRVRPDKGDKAWFCWNQTFPPGCTAVRVEYHIEPFYARAGNSVCQNVLYIPETGASWKGTIGQADIKVHFGEPVAREQIRNGTWPTGWWIDGNDLCWRFKELKPTIRGNIQVDCVPPKVCREIRRLRRAVAESPLDEGAVVALARQCFSLYDRQPIGYMTLGVMSCPTYDSLITRIRDPNERADFVKAWTGLGEEPADPFNVKSTSVWRNVYRNSETLPSPIQYQAVHVLDRKAIPGRRVEYIMSSAGFTQEEPSEFVMEGRQLLERLLERNPKNADAWLEYLTNCYLFVHLAYSPKARWLYWCPTPPKQKEIVERAYTQCPTNEGIKAWHDFVTSDAANTDSVLPPRAEMEELRSHLQGVPPDW